MNVFRAFRKNPPPTPEREGGLEFHRRSVALSPSAWLALHEIAKSEGITKSELVRRIVNSFLTDRDRPQFNPQRMALQCEYVQLVAGTGHPSWRVSIVQAVIDSVVAV